MAMYYAGVRAYLRALMAGDVDSVRVVIRRYPGLLDLDETLLAPLYFRRPKIFQYIAARVQKALQRERISTTALYGLVHWFGETGMTDLEPDVVRLLRHRDGQMRYIGLNVLSLHWDMRKWRREYERLLVDDRDADVRRLAAASLGYVLRETRDRRATRLLCRLLRDRSEDLDVRREAYDAARDLWFPAKQRTKEDRQYLLELEDKHNADPGAWERWVNWDLVAAMEKRQLLGRPRVPVDQRRRGSYMEERFYLLAVRAGDLDRVKAAIRRYPALLNEDATLLAPMYFQQNEITQFIAARLMRALRGNRVGGFSLRRLIDRFGPTRLTALETEVVRFLSHRNPEIRGEALSTLSLSWGMTKHRNTYERMLIRDANDGVRGTAAASLGFVLRGSRDRRATRLLVRIVRNKAETRYVRHEAYEALYEIWFPRALRSRKIYQDMVELHFKIYDNPQAWEQGVNWDLVAAMARGRVPTRFSEAVDRTRRITHRPAS